VDRLNPPSVFGAAVLGYIHRSKNRRSGAPSPCARASFGAPLCTVLGCRYRAGWRAQAPRRLQSLPDRHISPGLENVVIRAFRLQQPRQFVVKGVLRLWAASTRTATVEDGKGA